MNFEFDIGDKVRFTTVVAINPEHPLALPGETATVEFIEFGRRGHVRYYVDKDFGRGMWVSAAEIEKVPADLPAGILHCPEEENPNAYADTRRTV